MTETERLRDKGEPKGETTTTDAVNFRTTQFREHSKALEAMGWYRWYCVRFWTVKALELVGVPTPDEKHWN